MHKLGKLAPRVDPRTPKLHDFLAGPLYTPAKQDWPAAGKIGYWGMMLNDQLGDCVIASKGHLVILFTTLTGAHKNVILPDSVILAGYEAVGGYVPGKPNTDQGCNMLTAAQYYQSVGFGGHKITAYASVDYMNAPLLQAGVNLFGGVDLGVALPVTVQDQTGPGKVWDVPAGGAPWATAPPGAGEVMMCPWWPTTPRPTCTQSSPGAPSSS